MGSHHNTVTITLLLLLTTLMKLKGFVQKTQPIPDPHSPPHDSNDVFKTAKQNKKIKRQQSITSRSFRGKRPSSFLPFFFPQDW